jgi:hypothetical protein
MALKMKMQQTAVAQRAGMRDLLSHRARAGGRERAHAAHWRAEPRPPTTLSTRSSPAPAAVRRVVVARPARLSVRARCDCDGDEKQGQAVAGARPDTAA